MVVFQGGFIQLNPAPPKSELPHLKAREWGLGWKGEKGLCLECCPYEVISGSGLLGVQEGESSTFLFQPFFSCLSKLVADRREADAKTALCVFHPEGPSLKNNIWVTTVYRLILYESWAHSSSRKSLQAIEMPELFFVQTAKRSFLG